MSTFVPKGTHWHSLKGGRACKHSHVHHTLEWFPPLNNRHRGIRTHTHTNSWMPAGNRLTAKVLIRSARLRSWDDGRRSRADQSETIHDVMITCMRWHSLLQHHVTTDPEAGVRPCAPRQLPSHWLNNHSRRDFRDLREKKNEVLDYWMEWRFTPIIFTIFLLVKNSCLEGFKEALATGWNDLSALLPCSISRSLLQGHV